MLGDGCILGLAHEGVGELLFFPIFCFTERRVPPPASCLTVDNLQCIWISLKKKATCSTAYIASKCVKWEKLFMHSYTSIINITESYHVIGISLGVQDAEVNTTDDTCYPRGAFTLGV